MFKTKPILGFLMRKSSPPYCGGTRARLTVGTCSAWGRRGRMSDVRCFIGERACRNGSLHRSNERRNMSTPDATIISADPAKSEADFVTRVLPWPQSGTPGFINLHYKPDRGGMPGYSFRGSRTWWRR